MFLISKTFIYILFYLYVTVFLFSKVTNLQYYYFPTKMMSLPGG